MQEATPAIATTQPVANAPAAPLVLQPTQTFQTGPLSIGTPIVAASPDGRAVFLLTSEKSVNLWKSLVYLSPELLIGFGLLAAILVMRRVARRPQMLGEWHCRRCNYLLKNHFGDRCPECGSPLSPRTVMRGARRNVRIALLSSIAMLYLILYFSNGLSRMRASDVGMWLDWRTRSVNGLCGYFPAARAGIERLWSVARVDLQTGAQQMMDIDLRDNPRGVAISRDGLSVAVRGESGVYRYDWPTGRRSATVLTQDTSLRKRWRNLLTDAAFNDELTVAFVLSEDCEVERWDFATGQATRLFAQNNKERYSNSPMKLLLPLPYDEQVLLIDPWIPASITVLAGDNSQPPRRFEPNEDSIISLVQPDLPVLAIPYQPRLYSGPPADLECYGLLDARHITLRNASNIVPAYGLMVMPEQSWIVAETYSPTRDLHVWNTATGEYAFVIPPTARFPIEWVMLGDNRLARLYLIAPGPTSPCKIDVYELPGGGSR